MRSSTFVTAASVFALVQACSGGGAGSLPDGGAADAAPPDVAVDAPVNVGPARASLSASAIDFGLQDCGGSAPANQLLTLTNSGGDPLTWSVSLDDFSTFSLVGAASGTLAGGASATMSIAAKPVPSSASAGQLLHASLLLTTNDSTKTATYLPVQVTAQGATLKVSPGTVDFGQVPISTPASPIPLVISNTGNAPVAVAIDAPANGAFGVTWSGAPAAGTITPNGTLAGAALSFTPSTNKSSTTTSSLKVTGAVCGGVPDPIQISGEGLNGVVGVSPGTLDFGLVDCGSTGAAQELTIYNAGNAPFDFNAAMGLGAASPYVLSQSSGTVLPGSQLQLVVTPKGVPSVSAITANLYGDALTITTTANGDSAHVIALKETAQGAIVGATGPIAFGRKQVGSTPTSSLAITNTGNLAASVTLSATAPFSAPASITATLGNSSATIGYAPDPAQLDAVTSGTLSFSTSAPTCAPLPKAIALSGTSYDRAAAIGASGAHTCVVATSGLTYCWGTNQFGELGDGNTQTQRGYPAPVSGLKNAVSLGLGYYHSCALLQDSTVQCWGYGYYGQLGNGNTLNQTTPVSVSSLSGVVALSATEESTFALLSSGSIASWGYNYYGELGNGSNASSTVPVTVSNITDAVSIGGQYYEAACAVRSGGSVMCWGIGQEGNLGNGATSSSSTPVAVSNITNATRTTGGGYDACAVESTGSVACWGYDYSGQLGNGATANYVSTPVSVSNITDAVAVSLEYNTTCALRSGGGVMCWGNGYNGELGNGTTNANSLVPVAVSNITKASAIASGNDHTCVVNQDGTVLCWGDDGSGQLGNKLANTYSAIPVAVVGFD